MENIAESFNAPNPVDYFCSKPKTTTETISKDLLYKVSPKHETGFLANSSGYKEAN